MRRLGPALAASLVLAAILGRAASEPVEEYGDSGAGWIEHQARLEALLRWREAGGGPWEGLRAADGLYPPGLHLLTSAVGAAVGHSAAALTWTGALWLGLLALATGAVAGRGAAGAAALSVVLTPGLGGVATRYYYDLPMLALGWAAAAVLTRARRPAVGGAVAGLLFAGALLVKWSALPLLAPLLLAAALRGPPTAWAWRAGPALLITGALLRADLPSFGAMGGATFQPPPGAAALDVDHPAGRALALAAQALDGLTLDRIGFYPMRLLTTVLGPLGTLLVAGPLLAWIRAGAPGLARGLLALVPPLVFLIGAVPPLDDRFALGFAPAIAAAAARGLAAARLPGGVQAAALAVAALQALSLHAGGPRPLGAAPDPVAAGHAAPGGPLPGSPVDRRGWSRARDRPPARLPLREALLERVLRPCAPLQIGGPDAVISPAGDLNWWGYAERLLAAEGLPGARWVGNTPDADLWVRAPLPDAPTAHPPPGATRVGQIADPEGGPAVELWAVGPPPRCLEL